MDSAKGEAFVSAKGGLGTLSLKTGTVTAFGNAVSSPKGPLFVAADRDERKWTVPPPRKRQGRQISARPLACVHPAGCELATSASGVGSNPCRVVLDDAAGCCFA
ncbi:hypothetical protein [Streptomyces sp. NPDC048665]|uniref:hypothetical protein n=1 Tax=Streptomyces sp. NPDC048665 TaxID=3155490 RepID=UPI0034173B1D